MNEFMVKPVAYIHTDFKEKFGIPRQSGRAPSLTAEIIFTTEYRNPDALRGIEKYSHLWIIWQFSESILDSWHATVRPPRLGGNTSVGVFASRSPMRPNPIGLSSVRLVDVIKSESDGTILIVSGADMLNGTPIYDIKPYLSFTDSHPDAIDGFAGDVFERKLTVVDNGMFDDIEPKTAKIIKELLSQDPRPQYKSDPERVYGMAYGGYNVKFKVEGEWLYITEVEGNG